MNKIEKYLLNKKIKPNLKGFAYLTYAIEFAQERGCKGITTTIYPAVAKKFNDTDNKVERSIRHAIFNADIDMTNKEFIATAVLELK